MTIDEKRARLLDAAGFEFAEKGYEGATVRSICERAGVNLAAINYYYGDKERLYEAVLMHAHRSRPQDHHAPDDGEDPREALRGFVSLFLEEAAFQEKTAWHQALMFREVVDPTKASDTLVREAFRPRFQVLLGIIGRLAPGLDDRQQQAVGFGLVGQCLHYRTGRPISERIVGAEAFGRLDHDFLTDHITRATLAALGQGPPLGAASAGTTTDLVPPLAKDDR